MAADGSIVVDNTVLEGLLTSLLGVDFATETTLGTGLAAIIAKLSGDPSTATLQNTLITANHTDLLAVIAKLTSDSASNLFVTNEGRKATYFAAFDGVAPPTVGTGIMVSIIGSASKTVKITRVGLSISATAAVLLSLSLRKYSAAPTGGVSATIAAAKADTSSAAVTAVVENWTTFPTAGAALNTIAAHRLLVGTAAVVPPILEFNFSQGSGAKPIILSGVAETLGIFTNTAVGAGGVLSGFIEWTEE
jgi:hypothetical protein